VADRLAEGKRATDAGKWDLAIESYQQARSAAKAVGGGKSESAALAGMAEAEYGRSHDELAEKLARESLKIPEDVGDGYSIAVAPLMMTVQAPHCPSPQPNLGPRISRSSLRA
jgi:hypothetical protein